METVRGDELTRIEDIVLRDTDDNEIRIGDLWRDKTVIIVWLRHYG